MNSSIIPDNICSLIHKKGHLKSYHSDKIYHMTLNFIFSVVLMLNRTLNASFEPHLPKVLSCRHPCHAWHLGLGTPCEVVRPNFHALNN